MQKIKRWENFERWTCRFLGCDTARVSRPLGKLYLVIGHRKNTKDVRMGQWVKNGKKWDFTYVEETVVAIGLTLKELYESVKQYKGFNDLISDPSLGEVENKSYAYYLAGNLKMVPDE